MADEEYLSIDKMNAARLKPSGTIAVNRISKAISISQLVLLGSFARFTDNQRWERSRKQQGMTAVEGMKWKEKEWRQEIYQLRKAKLLILYSCYTKVIHTFKAGYDNNNMHVDVSCSTFSHIPFVSFLARWCQASTCPAVSGYPVIYVEPLSTVCSQWFPYRIGTNRFPANLAPIQVETRKRRGLYIFFNFFQLWFAARKHPSR